MNFNLFKFALIEPSMASATSSQSAQLYYNLMLLNLFTLGQTPYISGPIRVLFLNGTIEFGFSLQRIQTTFSELEIEIKKGPEGPLEQAE